MTAERPRSAFLIAAVIFLSVALVCAGGGLLILSGRVASNRSELGRLRSQVVALGGRPGETIIVNPPLTATTLPPAPVSPAPPTSAPRTSSPPATRPTPPTPPATSPPAPAPSSTPSTVPPSSPPTTQPAPNPPPPVCVTGSLLRTC